MAAATASDRYSGLFLSVYLQHIETVWRKIRDADTLPEQQHNRSFLNVCVYYQMPNYVIERCLEMGCSLTHGKRNEIVICAFRGNIDMLRLFARKLTKEQLEPFVNTKEAVTPLLIAAALGHVSFVEELIFSCHCDVNLCTPRHGAALHVCAERNHINVANAILKHPECDLNVRTADGETPLLICARKGSFEFFQLLVSHSAPAIATNNMKHRQLNLLAKDTNEGNTALHLCIMNDKDDFAKQLLKMCPELVYVRQTVTRQTPTFYASLSQLALLRSAYAQADTSRFAVSDCPALHDLIVYSAFAQNSAAAGAAAAGVAGPSIGPVDSNKTVSTTTTTTIAATNDDIGGIACHMCIISARLRKFIASQGGVQKCFSYPSSSSSTTVDNNTENNMHTNNRTTPNRVRLGLPVAGKALPYVIEYLYGDHIASLQNMSASTLSQIARAADVLLLPHLRAIVGQYMGRAVAPGGAKTPVLAVSTFAADLRSLRADDSNHEPQHRAGAAASVGSGGADVCIIVEDDAVMTMAENMCDPSNASNIIAAQPQPSSPLLPPQLQEQQEILRISAHRYILAHSCAYFKSMYKLGAWGEQSLHELRFAQQQHAPVGIALLVRYCYELEHFDVINEIEALVHVEDSESVASNNNKQSAASKSKNSQEKKSTTTTTASNNNNGINNNRSSTIDDETMSAILFDAFEVAHYFSCTFFMRKLESAIVTRLSVHNCLQCYHIAELYSSSFLLEESFDYIVHHFDELASGMGAQHIRDLLSIEARAELDLHVMFQNQRKLRRKGQEAGASNGCALTSSTDEAQQKSRYTPLPMF